MLVFTIDDMRSYLKYKSRAIALRRAGKTYSEIQNSIKTKIPQSTLSDWFKKANFSEREQKKIKAGGVARIKAGNQKTLAIQKAKRELYFQEIRNRLLPLRDLLHNSDVAKLTLMMLYWCEGGKHERGSVVFGNSDPRIITLFISLLRKCYSLDESKFRITVQCRADQNPKKLAIYWSRITGVSLRQFYKPQIDLRTAGKPSKQSDYHGVCRIDYFSAKIYHELVSAGKIF
jgi:hypothetical protein